MKPEHLPQALLLDVKSLPAVYAIFNVDQGKAYVGSARNVARRYKEHMKLLRKGRHHSPHLQRSWNLYGPTSFMFKVLQFVQPDELLAKEQMFIDFFDAACDETGYNINPRAESCAGRKLSLETKNKIAAKHTGRRLTEDHKKAISEAGRGRILSDDTRRNMRKAQQGYGGGNARLNEQKVLKIRALAAAGFKQKDIGQMFGIKRQHVGQIVNRKRWKHI